MRSRVSAFPLNSLFILGLTIGYKNLYCRFFHVNFYSHLKEYTPKKYTAPHKVTSTANIFMKRVHIYKEANFSNSIQHLLTENKAYYYSE